MENSKNERKEVVETINIDQAAESLLETNAEETPIETEAVEEDQVEEVESTDTENEVEETEEEEGEEDASDDVEDETDLATEEDDADETPEESSYTVKVDGEEQTVNLDELKRSYSGQAKIQKGMQEAANLRKESEQVYQTLQAEQQRFIQTVQSLQEQGVKAAPVAPDHTLIDTDPIGYMQEKSRYENQLSEYQAQQGEIHRVQEQNSQMQNHAQHVFLQEQAARVQELVPELADQAKAPQFKDRLVKTGVDAYGYSQEEMGSITDARAIAVLADALKWRDLNSGKAKAKKKPDAPRNVKPNARARKQPQKVLRNKQRAAARKSGKLEDFASLILNG